MDESPDALVRRVDEDRWLASRFAPRDIRARLIAIYALNSEIARTAEVVREPAIGDIRLAWWREALAEIHAGKPPRAHPALQAYAPLAAGLPPDAWETLTLARAKDFDAAPFANWANAESYVSATAGAVLRLAAAACAPQGSEDVARLLRLGALAWGYLGLAQAAPVWAKRGRTVLPGTSAEALTRSRAAHAELRKQVVPAQLFPAFGYLALVPAYRSGAPNLFTRQLRLVWASATGRL
jgi:phytoene synthase